MAKKKPLRLTVANGALLEAPAFESHMRGTNWLAIIDVDPTCPGGLSRRFLNRGRGECLYAIEQLGLFDAIEFGADYTTSVGNKRRSRWYGIVVAITEGALYVEECSSGAQAVVVAKEMRQSTDARKEALRIEREALLKRAEDLNREIIALEAPEEVVPNHN